MPSRAQRAYYAKLKDPRWQRLRLEVMERAEFRCEHCGDGKKTLNVHHGYYRSGAEPWDYEPSTLHCLCEGCHEYRQGIEATIRKAMALLPLDSIVRFSGYLTAPDVIELDLEDQPLPDCKPAVMGICDAAGMPWPEVVRRELSTCHEVLSFSLHLETALAENFEREAMAALAEGRGR